MRSLPGFLARRLTLPMSKPPQCAGPSLKSSFFYFVVGIDAMPAAHRLVTFTRAPTSPTSSPPGSAPCRVSSSRPLCVRPHRLQIFTLGDAAAGVSRSHARHVTTQFIEVLKNSAVAMMLGIEELTFQTQQSKPDLPWLRGRHDRHRASISRWPVIVGAMTWLAAASRTPLTVIAVLAGSPSRTQLWLWRGLSPLALAGRGLAGQRDFRWAVVWESAPFLLRGMWRLDPPRR